MRPLQTNKKKYSDEKRKTRLLGTGRMPKIQIFPKSFLWRESPGHSYPHIAGDAIKLDNSKKEWKMENGKCPPLIPLCRGRIHCVTLGQTG